MINTIFQLKRPRQIEIQFEDLDLNDESIIVRPTHLSICNADQRYYQGSRSEEILRKKLPMALIHEGIGKVIYDPTNTFEVGTSVVMIPNLPQEKDDIIAENYIRSSKFRASSKDGFLQEYLKVTPDRIVELPDEINKSVAAFTELVSVSYHAIKRFEEIAHKRRNTIAVWGDGNLGYITSLLLKHMIPDCKIIACGVHEQKLQDFTFVDETYCIHNIPEDIKIDHAFECVGGASSAKAINQIIDNIQPEGTISILGVSEDLAPINTRMILEKGLRVFGSSRSGREDFVGIIELYIKFPKIVSYLESIVGTQINVRNVSDIVNAFETDIHKMVGKTIMIWDE